MKMKQHERGSAIVSVTISISILAAVAGFSIARVMNRNHTLSESAAWQEALTAAEAGIHQGVAQLEQGLTQNSLATGSQSFTLQLSHDGERSGLATATYTLVRSDKTVGSDSRPFYGIVSKGSVALPGGRSLSTDTRDIILRKLSLRGTTRTADRTVVAWVTPVYNTDVALRTDQQLTLNNHNIVLDSFNSTSSDRSVSGQPGATLGQFNVAPYNVLLANMATNSNFIQAGNATVYGDAMTNGGTIGNTSGIQGEIRDDYYDPIAPVYVPSWSSTATQGVAVTTGNGNGNGNNNNTTMNVTSSATITGGSQSSPARYVLNSVKLSGSGDKLTFDDGSNGLGSGSSKGYIELYVIGDFSTKGGGTTDGAIVINKGVNVKIYVGGNMYLGGNGIENQNGNAASLSIYGINPTGSTTQTMTFAGSSQFFGTVYAPGADLKLAGGGADSTYVGSLTGKTAYLNGNTQIRYDEALAGKGVISRFRVVSWFEDVKKSGSFEGTL